MSFLLYVPIWVMVLLIILFSVALVIVGFKLIHKFYHYEHLEKYHSVISYIFNAYGLLYAVVIAFVVFINWSDYNNAQGHIYNEANQISNLFHDVQGFQEPMKTALMKSILNYTNVVYNTELAEMKKGIYSYDNNPDYNKLWNDFLKVDVKSAENISLYEKCLDELSRISESRRFRYFYLSNTIPQLIWVVMLIGCFISFSFSFFFGIKAKFPYFLLVIAFTFINIIILYLIYVLDHPYEGVNAISYAPIEKIITHFNSVIQGLK